MMWGLTTSQNNRRWPQLCASGSTQHLDQRGHFVGQCGHCCRRPVPWCPWYSRSV